MATERTTHNQRRLLVGLLVVATSLAVILGITALNAGGKGNTSAADASRPATNSTDTVQSATESTDTVQSATESTDTVQSATESTDTVRSAPSRSTTTTAPIAVDASPAAAAGAEEPSIGTTDECRADPACPSSEHRTSDTCGAALIVDQAGYLEGRHDAERGLPFQIDGAPAPSPADDDDDDATVGPQTRYRAGYVQGWCDGGGAQAASS
ncbi:MAG TPA: hypothetical protein VIZ67_08025 [Acidimicrobiales bacterium]